MITDNNATNLPQNLEIADWLMFSLTSKNEIDRQVALEEMTVNGVNPQFIQALTTVSENDPSQNCRSQAKWLLKLSETKDSLKTLIKNLDITPDFVMLQIQKGDYAKISLFSQMLRKAPNKKTINLWREALKKTTESHQLQVGLDILCKYGDESDCSIALKHIQNKEPQVVCSAFSILAKRDKEQLKKYIKLGLGSKSSEVVLHSLHLLKSIDEPESIKYLSVLLLNKNPLVRQKALREFMLITFEKVENLFWQYLAKEDQPFLLVKAGLLATFNPAQHFPFKIYDIMSMSTGVKQHILQMILKQTITTANASGILDNKDINTFLTEIKQYISNKNTEQTLKINVSNLKSPDVAIRADSIKNLSKYISYPKIKAILINHLKIEKDVSIKKLLTSILK